MVRRDGSKFPAELASVTFDDRNGLQQTSMLIRDLTGQKRAERTQTLLAELGAVLGAIECESTLRAAAPVIARHLGDVVVFFVVQEDGELAPVHGRGAPTGAELAGRRIEQVVVGRPAARSPGQRGLSRAASADQEAGAGVAGEHGRDTGAPACHPGRRSDERAAGPPLGRGQLLRRDGARFRLRGIRGGGPSAGPGDRAPLRSVHAEHGALPSEKQATQARDELLGIGGPRPPEPAGEHLATRPVAPATRRRARAPGQEAGRGHRTRPGGG